MPAGIAERVDGGYRLSGRWRFASGIRHAAWVGACAFVGSEDGVGRTVRLFVVRREAVLVHDNWHVLGLRGTGSCDFSMTDLFVPANFSFAYHVDPPRRGGALYRIRGPGQTANEHAAVALGTARRALEEVVAMAGAKTRGMQTQVRLGSRATFQRMIAESSVRLRAAHLLMVDTWERVWAAALAGEELPPAMHAELRAAATLATDVSLGVVIAAFRSLGGDALYDSSVLQRCLRDLNAAGQHFAVSDVAYEDLGRVMLGEAGGVV
jgi:alkylation response protein AidB-like acyl-CoA dehydrogenase